MSKGRWQHLDRQKPAGGDARPHLSAREAAESVDPVEEGAPELASAAPGPELLQARACYELGQFHACAELTASALAADPHLVGARRLLGLTLGRLGDPAAAARELSLAIREGPVSAGLLASLVSAQIEAGLLPEPGPLGDAGPAGELAGASAWLRGQSQLQAQRFAEAARSFSEAAERFARASPAEARSGRLAAAYVGEGISRLMAGQLEAAQQGFSRLAARGDASETAVAFARQLYEVVDAIRGLDPEERLAVLGPLRDLILRARLRVGFYDGSQPVSIRWESPEGSFISAW